MTTTARTVANTDLARGDRLVTPDGWITLTGDPDCQPDAPGTVRVDTAAGTLILDADHTSQVLAHPDSSAGDGDILDEDYLLANYATHGEIELFALGVALGRGRALGIDDAATIHQFCLADSDDRQRLTEFTGTPEDQLQPTAATALEFIQTYSDIPTYPRTPGERFNHLELYRHARDGRT